MHAIHQVSIPLLSMALVVLSAGNARADLSSCGDIDVDADAMCVVEVEGGCTAKCEPIRFKAACAAELYAECAGECSAKATVDCKASCNIGECMASCDIDPPSFECSASCKAEVKANCSASCAADNDKAGCEAACEATASAECDARCTGTPGNASCQAKCEASCEASCDAEANIDCQIDCQADGRVDCEASLKGGCEAQCQKPDGAIFCDGNYVDHGDNLAMCIDALDALLDVDVDASASAGGECAGGTCKANAEASVGTDCSVSPVSQNGAVGALVLSGLVLLGFRRRRR